MAKLSNQDAIALISLTKAALSSTVMYVDDSRKKKLSNALSKIFSDYELKDTSDIAPLLPPPSEEEVKQNMLHEEEKHRLEMLHDQEEHCLKMVKEYEHELSFVMNAQANLRKEAALFFACTLKEITNSLKESQIDVAFQKLWAKTLVDAYVKSIEHSTKLVEEHAVTELNEIREKAARIIKELKEE